MKRGIAIFIFGLTCSGLYAQVTPRTTDIRSAESDYTQGVFIVNEDWYGHQNSTVNFLNTAGEWTYRVFQKENPGHELGCTSQYGTIYGGKLYIVSKQERDPGAKMKGSRFTICNAKTMKVEKEFEFIATKTVTGKQDQDSLVSIADGRSYLPVDEHKGYIGTSNGIWLFDSKKLSIGKQIAGTGNPNGGGYGQLYYAQIGSMVRAGNYVFAVHQQEGLLVVDASTDQLVRTIKAPVEEGVQRGFGSIVQSKDGNLWISMATNTTGTGGALSYLLKLNPYTFQIDTISIPLDKGIGVIPNSWYAWTADGFCASAKENKIYWNGQDKKGSWFTGYKIFCYDIEKKEFSLVYDITALPGNWRLYGTGFRIHPATDELYAFCYHNFQDPTHQLVRISNTGEVLQEYPMIVNYWFPAIPVFPDNEIPVVSSKFPSSVSLTKDMPEYILALNSLVSDADNMSTAIVKTISSVTPGIPVASIVHNDSLFISATNPEVDFEATVTIQFNSNGRIVTKDLYVKNKGFATDNETVAIPSITFFPNPASDVIYINTEAPVDVCIFTMNGQIVRKLIAEPNVPIDVRSLASGMYFISIKSGKSTKTLKMIRK